MDLYVPSCGTPHRPRVGANVVGLYVDSAYWTVALGPKIKRRTCISRTAVGFGCRFCAVFHESATSNCTLTAVQHRPQIPILWNLPVTDASNTRSDVSVVRREVGVIPVELAVGAMADLAAPARRFWGLSCSYIRA